MAEYLLLLKINPGKIIDVMNALRSLPSKPSEGVDLDYTMNIFGTWDAGLWFKADDSNKAIDFAYKKVKDIPGVTDIYAVPTFPQEK